MRIDNVLSATVHPLIIVASDSIEATDLIVIEANRLFV